ncbi:class I SAM-dependent methyltransferase [Ruegeria meonggei]|uniref:Demethylrebeccamycin-D-glucose O-methyltransferase n=1 Tax=Ruegeria meonggei TaxID=1446476 RepID=A0A1X6Y3Y8_9RHOB|nr:class I SAM-dependent methyltransferase [Ruegeria meonggei]SLN09851.1 Demethylrebeccamycin-D-glucose O-methyltransferase [Ruegeria meonggei]
MQSANYEQAEFWGKSENGAKWLTYEDQLDHALAPVLDLVLDRAGLSGGQSVLDIGCGTGVSTLSAAGQVGAEGRILAVDISQPFLDRAAARSAEAGQSNISFQHADAQTFEFPPAQMDATISRFGVMFFSDSVAAFVNIAKALRLGGQMTFAAWGPLADNPWFRVPHVAAVSRLGQPPRVDRYAPGPLAFHDIDHVTGMMAKAGLSDIQAEAVPVGLASVDGADGTATLCTRVGPAARVIDHFEGDEQDVQAIQSTVAEEFRQFQTGADLYIPAVINLFQARRSE